MPSNQPNRDWRQGQASPAKSGAPRWRRPEKTGPRRPVSKKAKRIAAVGSLMGLVVLLAIVIKLLQPVRPAFLAVSGAAFDTNLGLPTDVYGYRTMSELLDVGSDTEDSGWWAKLWHTGALKVANKEPAKLGEEWLQSKDWWDSPEKTILLYLGTHGGVDKTGAFLFYEGENRQIQRLYIQKLLDRFQEEGPNRKNIVLLLDATQVDACWSQGLLFNDFARQLKSEVEQRKLPNLIVLCASGPDQRSWVSEEWQESIFGHCVVDGLKGAAENHGRITVQDLAKYVQEQVKTSVRKKRDAEQEPVLLGNIDLAKLDLRQVSRHFEGTPPDQAPGLALTDDKLRQQLGPVWTARDGLAQQVPSPAVYTPQQWRRYQDTVLRYEQLVRAGDPTGQAGALQDRLRQLAEQINDVHREAGKLNCLTNNLAMPAALGVAAPASRADQGQRLRDFRNWLKAQTKENVEALKAWEKKAGNARLWQDQTARLLLDEVLSRIGDAGQGNAALKRLQEAADRLHDLEGGRAETRPVEMQFLLMLARHVDAQHVPPAGLLKLALQVQRQAESVALSVNRPGHPYSEQVYRWIQKRVEQADSERRKGDDRLFGSTQELWNQARPHLEEAQKLYTQAGADGALVRQAFELRDSVEATLPYETVWLGRLESDPDGLTERVKKVDALWQDVHRLDDLLAKPDAQVIHTAPDGGDALDVLLPRIRDQYDTVHRAFDSKVQALVREAAVRSQRQRLDFENVLALPLLAADKRLVLIAALRHSSAELDDSNTKNATPGQSDQEQAHLQTALRQGRLAFAILGGTTPQRQEMADQLATLTGDRDKERTHIGQASETIYQRWQARAQQVQKGFQEAITKADVAGTVTPLTQADRLCRLLDGAATVPEDPFTPPEAYRRANFYGLFLWLAARTADDHWWSETPDAPEPYYVSAGKAYLGDARTLAKVGPRNSRLNGEREQTAVAALDKLKKATGLSVTQLDPVTAARDHLKPIKPDLTVTDERSVNVAYHLQADAGMPAGGTPLVWLDPGQNKEIKPEAGATDRQPVADPVSAARPVIRTYRLDRTQFGNQDGPGLGNRTPPAETSIAFHAFFRGQSLHPATHLTFYLDPDTVAYHYPPREQTSQLAVWADRDVAEGTITIVLDCSGSMNDHQKEPYTKDLKCKYHRATGALRQVLQMVPDNFKISLWLFAAKDKETNGNLPKPPIVHYQDPIRKAQLNIDDLIDRLDKEEPWYESPILESMIQAQDDLREANGLKTLLVLTDGDDNQWAKDDKDPQSRNLRISHEVRAQFENRDDLFVSVLLFQSGDPTEAKNAKDQFDVLNSFPHGNGQWLNMNFDVGELSAKDEIRLKDYLRAAMLPQLRLFHGGKPVGRVAPFVQFIRSNESGREDWYQLPAGRDYQAELYRRLTKSLSLAPEDQLILRLRRRRPGDRNSGVVFTREVYGNESRFVDRPKANQGGWLTTVMNSRLVTGAGSNFVDMLFSLENTTDLGADRGIISQIRPGFTWVEVQPETEKAARPRLHWGNYSPWPAPACDLWIPEADWPRTTADEGFKLVPGKLTVWWDPDPSAGNVKATNVSFTPAGGHDLSQLKNAWTLSTGETVTIEEAKPEQHQVVARKAPNSQPIPETKNCLALRLRYSGDEPVWVRLNGHSGGSEHRFYRTAHMATVLFWGGQVDALTRGDKPFTLSLISISDFKRSAQQTNSMAAPTGIPIQDLAR